MLLRGPPARRATSADRFTQPSGRRARARCGCGAIYGGGGGNRVEFWQHRLRWWAKKSRHHNCTFQGGRPARRPARTQARPARPLSLLLTQSGRRSEGPFPLLRRLRVRISGRDYDRRRLLPRKITRPHELISPIVIFRACSFRRRRRRREVCSSKKPRPLLRRCKTQAALPLKKTEKTEKKSVAAVFLSSATAAVGPTIGHWPPLPIGAEIAPPPLNSARNNLLLLLPIRAPSVFLFSRLSISRSLPRRRRRR